ncbi:MAG TPA: hypothetical protein VN610_00625 [Bryobacteraceae bacterium]|nr:hypothetical protein [Bryobacteraceae bacterium]
MDCKAARRMMASCADDATGRGWREVGGHLAECTSCAREAQQHIQLRRKLRSIPKLTPPPELTMRLRVLASRERAKRQRGADVFGRSREFLKLSGQHMMRHLAVPLAGGLCATLLLFSSLIPTFTQNSRAATPDVPTAFVSGPALKSLSMGPLGFSSGDAVVDLTIDGHGRVIDFAIVSDSDAAHADALRRNIENNLLFTVFTPATAFGRPTDGKIRVKFSSSHYEVRG